ncbi:MAG TPA: LytTR family DNA-binding domain-containing protein [Bacteroidia bacterium]|nr:LytTR family DNA-binding domain-containing protein [Bacteroidia bacterium]
MNCIIVDDEELSQKAMKHLVSQVPYLNLVAQCSNGSEALDALSKNKVDLLFLDIEMPVINGLEFVKSLKNPPITILATSKKEYAIEAFECNVIDYLVKPIAIDRFFNAVTKAKHFFDNIHQNIPFLNQEYIFVKVNGILTRISIKEILWIEALGDYIVINTAEKKYTVHSTLKAIENKLDSDKYVRVHRSYIVSIDNINSIDDNTIVINKQLIPIGLVHKENLTKKLNLL